MSPEQKELSRHALGLKDDRNRSFRNRYFVGPGSPSFELWKDLVGKGMAGGVSSGPNVHFWLTHAGATAALNPGEHLCDEDFPIDGADWPTGVRYFTDYPISELGDKHDEQAPIRQCLIHSYDGDKYVDATVRGVRTSFKAGYVYPKAQRRGEGPVADPKTFILAHDDVAEVDEATPQH